VEALGLLCSCAVTSGLEFIRPRSELRDRRFAGTVA